MHPRPHPHPPKQVKSLKEGKAVDKPIYNHVTGILDPAETINPANVGGEGGGERGGGGGRRRGRLSREPVWAAAAAAAGGCRRGCEQRGRVGPAAPTRPTPTPRRPPTTPAFDRSW